MFFSVVDEKSIAAIQPRQWRQHGAVGETHGHDYFYSPKPRQGRQQPEKCHPAAPAGALKPRQFTSVVRRPRHHAVASPRLSFTRVSSRTGAVQLYFTRRELNPGERSGVSPPSPMRATRWANTHRSPKHLNVDRAKYNLPLGGFVMAKHLIHGHAKYKHPCTSYRA